MVELLSSPVWVSFRRLPRSRSLGIDNIVFIAIPRAGFNISASAPQLGLGAFVTHRPLVHGRSSGSIRRCSTCSASRLGKALIPFAGGVFLSIRRRRRSITEAPDPRRATGALHV
jgi:hypothetical protein